VNLTVERCSILRLQLTSETYNISRTLTCTPYSQTPTRWFRKGSRVRYVCDSLTDVWAPVQRNVYITIAIRNNSPFQLFVVILVRAIRQLRNCELLASETRSRVD
jgi:hypothetical protein